MWKEDQVAIFMCPDYQNQTSASGFGSFHRGLSRDTRELRFVVMLYLVTQRNKNNKNKHLIQLIQS